ncbi:MAG: hypothetical protein AAFR37_23575 [Cyanobacteria bacterium J06628_3]
MNSTPNFRNIFENSQVTVWVYESINFGFCGKFGGVGFRPCSPEVRLSLTGKTSSRQLLFPNLPRRICVSVHAVSRQTKRAR